MVKAIGFLLMAGAIIFLCGTALGADEMIAGQPVAPEFHWMEDAVQINHIASPTLYHNKANVDQLIFSLKEAGYEEGAMFLCRASDEDLRQVIRGKIFGMPEDGSMTITISELGEPQWPEEYFLYSGIRQGGDYDGIRFWRMVILDVSLTQTQNGRNILLETCAPYISSTLDEVPQASESSLRGRVLNEEGILSAGRKLEKDEAKLEKLLKDESLSEEEREEKILKLEKKIREDSTIGILT